MRWQAPSERTQLILLAPIIVPACIVLVPTLALMTAWQKLYALVAPSREYHRWFAWRPVRHFNDRDWLWLEYVERRWCGHGVGCVYRFYEVSK